MMSTVAPDGDWEGREPGIIIDDAYLAATDDEWEGREPGAASEAMDYNGILTAGPRPDSEAAIPRDRPPQMCTRRRMWGMPVGYWSSPGKDEKPWLG